jgi:hypothetical protein
VTHDRWPKKRSPKVIGPMSQLTVMRSKGLRSQRIPNQISVTTREDEELQLTEKQRILRITGREAREPFIMAREDEEFV